MHNETLNTGLDETFEQSFHEEMDRLNLLIPDFHKAKTPSKDTGLLLSSKSSTRLGTGLKSPRLDTRASRSPEAQEIKRQIFLEESLVPFDKKLFAGSVALPKGFERLEEQGFAMGQIEQEEQITQELLKVGRGLLGISRLVQDSLAALRSSKREEAERVIPALGSRIDCGRERLSDYKKRLRNNFKVCLE